MEENGLLRLRAAKLLGLHSPLEKNECRIAAPNMHMQQQQSNAHTAQDACPLPLHLPGWPVARGTAGTMLPGCHWEGDRFTLRLSSGAAWDT